MEGLSPSPSLSLPKGHFNIKTSIDNNQQWNYQQVYYKSYASLNEQPSNLLLLFSSLPFDNEIIPGYVAVVTGLLRTWHQKGQALLPFYHPIYSWRKLSSQSHPIPYRSCPLSLLTEHSVSPNKPLMEDNKEELSRQSMPSGLRHDKIPPGPEFPNDMMGI